MNSVISPDEFTYLLKPCKSFVPWNKTSLSKPVLCSELWPLLGHCTFLNFDIDNFIYDDKMSQMLSCMPCDIAKLYLYKIGLREDIVFPIVALFLKLLIKHVKLSFCHDDSNQSCESMAAVIEKKFKAAGFRVEKRNESRLNRTIEIRMPRDYEVYVAFYD
uniref:Retrovirus-related Pol polyprotein from transposon 17.6 n=1 Tax=Panagrellus redivivus TaxID=6233 RepID=A0A7E4V7Z7_PANRE